MGGEKNIEIAVCLPRNFKKILAEAEEKNF